MISYLTFLLRIVRHKLLVMVYLRVNLNSRMAVMVNLLFVSYDKHSLLSGKKY